MAGRQNR